MNPQEKGWGAVAFEVNTAGRIWEQTERKLLIGNEAPSPLPLYTKTRSVGQLPVQTHSVNAFMVQNKRRKKKKEGHDTVAIYYICLIYKWRDICIFSQ